MKIIKCTEDQMSQRRHQKNAALTKKIYLRLHNVEGLDWKTHGTDYRW